MKKLFVASALALALTMAGHQRASAWSEFKFSAGVNFGWVGGGNRIAWGLYHSGPTPGAQDVRPLINVLPYAPPPVPVYGGFDHAPVAPVAPYAPDWHGPVPHVGAEAQPMPSSPAGYGGLQQTYTPYYSGYQPVSYYYPASYYQAPTYWYGR